jgi:tetratricopeptide (TPR) repeat protein
MSEKVQEILFNAEVAFNSGKYEASLELFKSAIAEDPSNAQAYTGAGRMSLLLNSLLESEMYFQKAADIDVGNGERFFDLGNIQFGLAKNTEALVNYSKAEKLGCSDGTLQKIYYQVGLLNHAIGDTKSAIISFDKADDIGIINEDTKGFLIERLKIYLEIPDIERAENTAAQLKLLAPGDYLSYQACFQVMILAGKYKQAEELLVEAEKYSDINASTVNSFSFCVNKAMIFAAKAESDPDNLIVHNTSAIAVFDEYLTTPDLPEEVIVNIALAKAELFLKLEKFNDALQCVDSIAIKGNPDGISIDADESNEEPSAEQKLKEKAVFIKLTCYLGLEDYDKARDYAERLKVSSDEQYEYFAIYADAFIAQKLAIKDKSQKELAVAKYNNAIAYFKNKAFASPTDLFSTVFRIRLYSENGKFANAEELIKILPDEIQADLSKYLSDCRKEQKKR